MENTENVERFVTTLTPIANNHPSVMLDIQYDVDGFPIGYRSESSETIDENWGVARIDTVSSLGNAGEEPVRWLILMGERNSNNNNDSEDLNILSYAMIDLPPYSDTLADEIRGFMDCNSDQDENSINNTNGENHVYFLSRLSSCLRCRGCLRRFGFLEGFEMDQNTNRRTKYQKNSSVQIVNRNTILLFVSRSEDFRTSIASKFEFQMQNKVETSMDWHTALPRCSIMD
jgi:hypothetical protein